MILNIPSFIYLEFGMLLLVSRKILPQSVELGSPKFTPTKYLSKLSLLD